MLLKSDYEGWLVFKAKRLNGVNNNGVIYIYSFPCGSMTCNRLWTQ